MRWLGNVALFLLPFVVYFSYARWANARRAATGTDPLLPPWYWLIVLGSLFAIVGFFAMRAFTDVHTGAYVPAAMGADGKIVPGHYEDDDGPPRVPPPQTPPPEPPPKPVTP